jgi:hypothetical protein
MEGGLSTGLQRTFVSRDCRYFKVDVEFRAVGRPDRPREDSWDIILKISRLTCSSALPISGAAPYQKISFSAN